jgi:hypothetical protein
MGFALKKHVHETDALCAECCAHLARPNTISFVGKLVEARHDISDFVFAFFGREPVPYLERDRLGPVTKPVYDEIVEPEKTIEARTAEAPPAQIEAREIQKLAPALEPTAEPILPEAKQSPKQQEDWQKLLRTAYFQEKLLNTQAKPPKEFDRKGRYVRDWAVIGERITPKPKPIRTRKDPGPYFTAELQESLEEQIKAESDPFSEAQVEQPIADPDHAQPTFLLAHVNETSLEKSDKLPEVLPAPALQPARNDHPWRKLYEKEIEESLPEAPKIPARKGARKHNHDGRTVCEECLIQLVSPGSKTWAEVRENLLVIWKVVFTGAKALAIGAFGITMFFASIFPESIKATTPEEAELLRKDAEERKKKKIASAEADRAQWEAERSARELGSKAGTQEFYGDYARRNADTEEARKEWDDRKAKFESERNKQDDEEHSTEQHFVNKYNQTIQQINIAVAAPWWDTHDDFVKDDKMVTELNHMMHAVERGKEDPDRLNRLQRELSQSRDDKNRKDAARDLHHGRFMDLCSKARKCMEQAQIAQSRRDFAGRDNLMKEGEALWREAEGAMNQFRSV